MAVAASTPANSRPFDPRHDWRLDEVAELFAMPFNDLLFRAQTVHRANFDPNTVQVSSLISIKTGSCSEDCKYCPQSAHYDTGLERERLLAVDTVATAAAQAKAAGASRFCMGAAWRGPASKDFDTVLAMVEAVKSLGMETCASLGLLTDEQARRLKDAGLDYYNHNIDTSEDNYAEIISTRTFQDRMDTLMRVRDAGMKICCGGIVGLGEAVADRAKMLISLANMSVQPESVPINLLIRIPGTPLGDVPATDPIDFVRTIAVARIMLPKSFVRLSAGRQSMSDELQALCFLAGANSMFGGEKLLTADNPSLEDDAKLLSRLGLRPI